MLPFLLLDHWSSAVSRCAAAILEGQDDDWGPMLDALCESGEYPMLDVGKCYMVKTPTIYYLGKVKHASYVSVTLESVSEVYDTGDTLACWETGKPTSFENYSSPKIEVRIPVSSIIAAPEWDKPLLY